MVPDQWRYLFDPWTRIVDQKSNKKHMRCFKDKRLSLCGEKCWHRSWTLSVWEERLLGLLITVFVVFAEPEQQHWIMPEQEWGEWMMAKSQRAALASLNLQLCSQYNLFFQSELQSRSQIELCHLSCKHTYRYSETWPHDSRFCAKRHIEYKYINKI